MKATPGSEEVAERSLNSSSQRFIGQLALRVATYPSGVGSGRVRSGEGRSGQVRSRWPGWARVRSGRAAQALTQPNQGFWLA